MILYQHCRYIPTVILADYPFWGNTMKMKYSLLFVAFLMLLTPLKASAVFDGERHGFMMNIGGGFGQGRFSWQGNSVDGTGFIADIKIGGGPSDQVHIYYVNQALWYSPGSRSSRVINAFYGGGVSYYLEPQAPSLFFSGALGLGMLIERRLGWFLR